MKKALLIAADVDARLVARLSADERFEIVQDLAVAEILVTRSYNRVDRALLDAAPRLELIAQGTSGIDNIDAEAARERGIAIVSLPGENANAVAELVVAFMLMMTRTIPQYTEELRRGLFRRDDCATRHELRHYRLGIVGLGEVGRRVARLASAFGVRVSAYDPYIDDFHGTTRADSLDALLTSSDILTLHVPLTNETRRMIATPRPS